MGSLRDFAGKLRAYANYIPDRAHEIRQDTAREVLKRLVQVTPVLKGEAKSNWIVSSGSADNSTVRAKEQWSLSGAISLTDGESRISSAPRGSRIHITNNVPYIGELNAGSSRQAPAGFIEQATRAGTDYARSQVISWGRKK